ncbi:MAG TPA: DinB family protein [Pseudonocardiaceae bacterium]
MDRVPEPTADDERGLLLGWLAFHRDALAAKCAGLTDEQLVTAAAPPSDLSLLGLVRHLSEMERHYLVRPLSGVPLGLRYCTDDNPEGDIEGLMPSMAGPSLDVWRAEVAEADRLLAAYPGLDGPVALGTHAVRWYVVKVLQEYARHNGHADLLRERIDGARGE